MDKFRADTANALIAHGPDLARWVAASLPSISLGSQGGTGKDSKSFSESVRSLIACLAEAIRFEEPELFLHSVRWAESRRLEDEPTIERCVSTLQSAARNCLPGDVSDLIAPVLDKAFSALDERLRLTPGEAEEKPFSELAAQWLTLLLSHEGREARPFVFRCLSSGLSPLDLFDHVFTPGLRDIGLLWQRRKIDEAHEHFCATLTQSVLGLVAAEQNSAGVPCVAVGFCPPGEMHDVGIRMMCEGLYLAGWNSSSFGANVPIGTIGPLIQKWRPDAVAISVTMAENLAQVSPAILAIRSTRLPKTPKVFVGGLPFQICPALVAKVGADATAQSCSQFLLKLTAPVGS